MLIYPESVNKNIIVTSGGGGGGVQYKNEL